MKLKKAMLLFAAAAVAAGTVAGCSGSAKETTAASVAETSAEETKEETTAEETKEEETAAEEEDEENYDTGDAALDNTRIEDAIEKAEPDFSVRRGFTSQIIIDHVKKRDDVTIDNVTEALDRAVNNGVKTLVVQPTHLMNGLEYTDLVNEIAENADSFEKVVVGEPLLTSDDDFKAVIQAITDATKEYDDGETAICFMGHGTEADSNQVYAKMQDMLTEEGFEHYYVGTVEATPSLEDVVAKVKEGSYKKVVLEPLMIVAGDHANNDMAGDEEGSWKTTFEEAGYEVTCLVRGLGELEPIQQLFVEHAKAAVDSLAK